MMGRAMRSLASRLSGAVLFIAVLCHASTVASEPLPKIGEAPGFALTAQDGREVTLASLRGRVVAVAFIYTWCPDVCPILTATMADVRDELGPAFGADIVFVTITFDPLRDTVEVLRAFSDAFGADPRTWMFLTGEPAEIQEVTARYGVITVPGAGDTIDHNLLTTLIDRNGVVRVQYSGWQFSADEFYHDLLALAAER